VLNPYVFPIDVSEVAQSLQESTGERIGIRGSGRNTPLEKADPRNPQLLRVDK
jgi:hypothetical protein